MMEFLLHVTVSASALFLCILPWRIFARDRIPPVFFRTAWILLACRMLILVPLVSPAGILCTPAISVSASEAFPLPGILPRRFRARGFFSRTDGLCAEPENTRSPAV